jgi:predicted nuclease of restriction endonuclease-like (RecB) superfamily
MSSISQNTEFKQVIFLIEDARNRAFQKVNNELVMLYFNVGKLVSEKVSAGTWGESTVDELALYIMHNCPGMKGFNRRGLYRMKQFYETYSSPDFVSTLMTQMQKTESEAKNIVTTLLTQLQWSAHLHILSKTKSPDEKLFYIHIAIQEKISVRELERQLNAAIYERTTLSNHSLQKNTPQLPKNFFKDPYIFEFLELTDGHSEKDLEKALILNLQKFILLCKGKDSEVVEYAMACNTSSAIIADYETKLIPKKVLVNKLHQLVDLMLSNRD